MISKRWYCGIFVAVMIVQLAVPCTMIAQHESLLRKGAVYKFRTQPVDPYDAFRGRFVALALNPNEVATPPEFSARDSRDSEKPVVVYVTLGVDADGFATFRSVSSKAPQDGDYLRVQGKPTNNGRLRLKLPFDRYYMDEFSAPAAEIAYRQHSRSLNADAHVTVRIRKGRGCIEELFIAGQPIAEFLKNANGKSAEEKQD